MEIKIKNWFDKEDKIDFTNESSEEIRKKIKYNKKYLEQGYEEIEKRKEETIDEKVSELFNSLIFCGMIILIIGIIYLGSIPTYFGVDDLIINGTNQSGLNVTMDLVKDIGANTFVNLYNLPKEKSVFWINGITFWFWFFWSSIFILLIYPIIKFVIFLITRWNKKTKKI